MIKVMIIEAHGVMRSGLRRLVDEHYNIGVVAEVASHSIARQKLRTQRVDVVLMALGAGQCGNIDATRQMLYAHPSLKIIGLCTPTLGLYPRLFLQAGGMGYLSKTATSEALKDAITQVARGKYYISQDTAANIALSRDGDMDVDIAQRLSEREFEVMELVCNGFNVSQISNRLNLSPTTVSSHRRRLWGKLGVSNDVQLLRLASHLGMSTH